MSFFFANVDLTLDITDASTSAHAARIFADVARGKGRPKFGNMSRLISLTEQSCVPLLL